MDLIKTGKGNTIQGQVSHTVLNSQAVQSSFATNKSFFLSQAFPEGSPTHPAYPTGHGTVAGACITILKFFFDGDFVIPNPKVPSNNGAALHNYTGGDAGQMTVNGELHKLAHNISFGHGIHPGQLGKRRRASGHIGSPRPTLNRFSASPIGTSFAWAGIAMRIWPQHSASESTEIDRRLKQP